MHIFDIIVLIVLSILTLFGIKRGFIREIFHLAAMIGGFIGAFSSYPLIYNKLNFLKTSSQTKTAISFILAYIFIALTLILIGWFLRKIIHLALLGWIDRLLGGLFGALKTVLIVWVFVLCISLLPSSNVKSSFSSSRVYSLILELPIHINIPNRAKLKDSYKTIKESISIDKFKSKISPIKQYFD